MPKITELYEKGRPDKKSGKGVGGSGKPKITGQYSPPKGSQSKGSNSTKK